MIIKGKDNGYVLITSLLMLLVLTVIGLAAMGTSSLDNLLSGNIRLKEMNTAEADGCADISTAVIERVAREGDTRGFAGMVSDANMPFEISSTPFDTDPSQNDPAWDVTCSVGGQTVNVDLDMMYSKWGEGSSIEFASGYEGVGKGGNSGAMIYYRINSTGFNTMGSASTVGTIYKYVPKN